MKRRALSLLMCLLLIVGVMPTTALAAGATDTWAVKLNVSESDAYNYNGQKVLALGFGVQSDNLTIRKAASMVLAVDLEILDFIQYDSDGNAARYEPSAGNLVLNSDAVAEGKEIKKKPAQSWAIQVNCSKSPDGKIGYMQMLASQDYVDFVVTTPQDLATAYLGFKSGKSVSNLQKNSIRFITPTECVALNQSSAVEVTNGKGGMQQAIMKDDSTPDTLKVTPEVVWNGITPSEPAKPALKGSVTIDNTTPKFGDTLTAQTGSLDYNGAATGGTLTYQWYRGTEKISDATGATYTTIAADMNNPIKVEVMNSNNSGSVFSVETAKVAKANYTGSAAVSPTGITPTHNSVSFTGTTGQEYAYTLSSVTTAPDTGWAPVSKFDNLDPNTQYNLWYRIAATDTVNPSAALNATFTTLSAPISDDAKGTLAGYTGDYDGNPHNAITGVAQAGYTVTYSTTDASSGFSSAMPTVTNVADTKTVWVKLSKTGSADKVFEMKATVTAKDIGSATITLGTPATYDGNEKTVGISKVTVDSKDLGAGADYSVVSGNKATDVGDTTLKIKGEGNYTGTASTTWSLRKADLYATDFDIPGSSASVDYSGDPISVTPPSLTSPKTGAGKITVYYTGTGSTNYSKSTTAPTEVGTYDVTFDVAGGKNFNAASDLTYGPLTIQAKIVSGLTAVIGDQTTVRGEGQFVDPVIKGVKDETLEGTLTYAYGTESGKTHDEVVTMLATKDTDYAVDLTYTFTPNSDNYTGTNTGTFKVTVKDIAFTVDDGSTAYASNAINELISDTTYGATWNERISLNTITAKVGTDTKAGTFTIVPDSGNLTDRPGVSASGYTVKFSSDDNAYTDVTVFNGSITVTPREVTVSGITANNKEYDGGTTATVDTTNATFPELVSGDTLNISVTGATFEDANVGENKTVTLTLGALSGTSAANYTLAATGNQTETTADITARTLTITDAAVSSKDYDGDTNADVTGVIFNNLVPGESLTIGMDYTVTGVFNSADAATDRTVTVTVTLKDTVKNYALPTATFDKPGVSINKIDHPTYGTTQTGNTNALKTTAGEKTYNLPYSDLAGVAYTVTAKTTVNIVDDVPPTIAGNVLTYTSKVCATANATDTITIKIESTNYNDITLTLTVTATDKAPVTISGLTYTDKTYDGNAITPTGTLTVSDNKVPVNELEVLYTSTDGAGYSAATAPKDAGAYKVEYKVADSNPNYTGSESYTFTINKKAATVAPKAVNITKGSAIPAFELVYTGLVSGDSLAPSAAPTFNCFEADGTTAVSTSTAAGTYTITWTNTGITFTGANNYDLTKTETATLTISNPSSSGGGGSYTPSYTVSVDKTANGTVTVTPKTAKKGDTVTLTATPDKDYELDTIKALDKDGKSLKLTDQGNGKYTFTMPAGKVTVKAAFAEVPQQIFADVPTDAFYYEAVKWAAEKKITDGVGNDLFAPNQPCSRAQIVTFLWRAAGSPDPKNMTTFTDVAQNSFYAKAVAWAVENGITKGTGDGKFSPNATCSRAQAVTFLYRASGVPAVSGSAEFSDVAANAYYAAAVKWAEQNGVTEGIGGGLFGSNNDCTRAQIVTFLYRSVK